MKNSKTLILLLLFVVASTNVYAVQDSIIPLTAKTAWKYTTEKVVSEYGVLPTLFKAYPEKDIDKNDTLLCVTYKTQFGYDTASWKGTSYKWVFECRVPELSKDTMFIITTYLKPETSVNIIIDKIFKPITDYADTIGIAEGTWIDSDSLAKISVYGPGIYIFFPVIFLERNLAYGIIPIRIRISWNKQTFHNGEWDQWVKIDAQTGKIVEYSVTSVSEPLPSEAFTISPNPTSTSFSISGIDGVSSLRIMNSLGMEAKKITVNSEKLIVDVSDLASGVYFVQFRSQMGVISKPIVVSR